jgi:hypothetical protein
MPANFNQQLYVNAATGYVEYPTGPLVRVDGEQLLRVEAWVMQKLTGAVQMTWQDTFAAPYNVWVADKKWYPQAASWAGGVFQKGEPALGVAVLISLRMGVPKYFWWSEEVELY